MDNRKRIKNIFWILQGLFLQISRRVSADPRTFMTIFRKHKTLLTIVATWTATMAAYYTLQEARKDWRLFQRYIKRHKLPQDLVTWEMLEKSSPKLEEVWKELYNILRDGGYTLWPTAPNGVSSSPGRVRSRSSSALLRARQRRMNIGQVERGEAGTVGSLDSYNNSDPLSRTARTREGRDVIIRVIAVKKEGHKHIRTLRRIATGEVSLCSDNHTLPLLGELEFEDIIFGIFPKVGGIVKGHGADGTWAMNSVGDIVDMLMQMLEALVFIHRMNIAHCDAFCDNFVIQWQPESLKKMKISPCRPRIYLTNFEYAVEFPSDLPRKHRILWGPPQKNRKGHWYTRPAPTEVTSLHIYDPFKLDVWQVGSTFLDITMNVGPIDAILMSMVGDTTVREGAQKTLNRLTTVVQSMTAASLLFPPITLPN